MEWACISYSIMSMLIYIYNTQLSKIHVLFISYFLSLLLFSVFLYPKYPVYHCACFKVA